MSTEALLQERKSTHGEYKEHARCTQAIMRAVMTERNWEKLSDIQRESLHMFAHKMGRIAVGNPDEPDHWKDIAGYAVLVEQRLGSPQPSTLQVQTTEAMVKRVLELPQNNVVLGPVPGDETVDGHVEWTHPIVGLQRTPEDGAQHASVVPWAVTPGYLRIQGVNPEHVAAFWHKRTSSSFVLEPYVISGTIPRVLRTCYNLRGDGNWTLRIGDCPPDVREFFPDLPMEQNMKEWEERPEWQRVLYTWSVEGNKYALTDHTRAWHVESE